MRQSPYLIQQSYLDLICPYNTEPEEYASSTAYQRSHSSNIIYRDEMGVYAVQPHDMLLHF